MKLALKLLVALNLVAVSDAMAQTAPSYKLSQVNVELTNTSTTITSGFVFENSAIDFKDTAPNVFSLNLTELGLSQGKNFSVYINYPNTKGRNVPIYLFPPNHKTQLFYDAQGDTASFICNFEGFNLNTDSSVTCEVSLTEGLDKGKN